MPQAWPTPDVLAADPALIAGIAAYRRHPAGRTLPELPTLWAEGGTRLLDAGGDGPTVLLVPSLVNRAHILDLDADGSLLRWLANSGVRGLLLDWGWPGPVERGFTTTDYVAGRLERSLAAMPGPVVLVGYCMGGLLALAAALRRPDRVRGLALLATPWDFHADDGAGRRLAAALPALEPVLAATGTLPVDVVQTLFALLDDGAALTRYRDFAALPQDSVRAKKFVLLEDWLNDGVPLAAPVARECLGSWYGANATAAGRWRVAGAPVLPQALTVPAFVALPGRDRVVPPGSAAALADALPRAERHAMAAGHVGMVVGSGAPAALWAPLRAWVEGLPSSSPPP